MAKNHLIIGLGGTGGKVIREFRKNIFQDFRVKEFQNLPANDDNRDLRNTHIRYLYIDSSDRDLSNVDSWKILGDDVALSGSGKMLLPQQNLKSVLDYIEQQPGLKPWIGDADQWPDTIASGSETAAGQKRRYGRFLFAMSANSFCNCLNSEVGLLKEKSGQSDVTFHVCCGVAGGTGSGTLVDVISQIRKEYPPEDLNKYEILLYVQLPERNNKLGWAQKNYYANGYAALAELNALMVKKFKPWDVTKGKGALDLSYPFNACFVYTNENEEGLSLDVREDLPRIASDFLYHKITFDQQGELDGISRIISGENADEIVEKDQYGKLARSKRFLTFGIKRVAVPVEEIREYFAYNFARQGILKMQYNLWDSGKGYLPEPKEEGFASIVKEQSPAWMLSDEYLTYSLPVLEQDRKFTDIDQEWQLVMGPFIEQTKASAKSGREWNTAIMKSFDDHFNKTFREHGVDEFFRLKAQDKDNIAKEVKRKIDYYLFEQMRQGEYSLYKISRILKEIVGYVDQRLESVDEQIGKARREVAGYEEDVNHTFEKLTNVGPLSETFFGKKSRLLEAQGLNLKNWYRARTWLRAWEFAKEYLPVLKNQLAYLQNEVGTALGRINETLESFDKLIAERCDDTSNYVDKINKRVVRFYDATAVKEQNERYLKEEDLMKRLDVLMRDKLFQNLDEVKSYSFSRFNHTGFEHYFVSNIESAATEFLDSLYAEMESGNPSRKLLEPNIIEKLYEEFGSNQRALDDFVSQVVASASCYATFNSVEKSGDASLKDHLYVILPNHDNKDFLNQIRHAFENSKSGVIINFIPTDSITKEITILNAKNLFPLRYLNIVGHLRKKYEERITDDGDAARFILHLEGDGSDLPSLFRPTMQEEERELEKQRKEIVKFLLLAHAMQIINCQEDPGKGNRYVVLKQKDENGGRGRSIILCEGENLVDVYSKIVKPEMETLKETVGGLLNSPDFVHKTVRAEKLKPAVLSEEENVYKLRGENDFDPIVKDFNLGKDEAILMLKL